MNGDVLCYELSVFCFLFAYADIEGWAISPRGAGFLFGGDIMDKVSTGWWVWHIGLTIHTLQ